MSTLTEQFGERFMYLLDRIANNEEVTGTRNDMTQAEIFEERIEEIVRLCVLKGDDEECARRKARHHVYARMIKVGRGNELVLETQQ